MTLKTSLTYFTLILFFTLLPLVSGEYYVNLGSQIMIAAVFAASLNLLVGYGGLTSLGHASFLGLAAYVSAWLYLNMGMGHAYSAPIALGLTTLVGALFGWISLRASGLSFLMLTLALSQIVWGVGYRWVSLTNGDNGLSIIQLRSLFSFEEIEQALKFLQEKKQIQKREGIIKN